MQRIAMTENEPIEPVDAARMQVAIALAQASLCLESSKLQKRAKRWLEKELERQILADGGHVSRNPGSILQILVDLLPLRQTYANQAEAPPQALIGAIDRMLPALRFFRHQDGLGPNQACGESPNNSGE